MNYLMSDRIIQRLILLAMLAGLTQATLAAERVTRISPGIDSVSIIETSNDRRKPMLERIDVEVKLDIEGLLLDHSFLMGIDPRTIQSATVLLNSGTSGETQDHQYVQFYYDDANTMVSGCHDIDNQQSVWANVPVNR